MCDTQSRVRTRRLICFFVVVLSLGATGEARQSEHARRIPVSFDTSVSNVRTGKKQCFTESALRLTASDPFPVLTSPPASTQTTAQPSAEARHGETCFVTRYRFQLPPPALTT